MIKLVKVNKYFNRFRRNKNHVINNTSLEFGETGLVSILGNSGSGKTTLLNAIGGLDKVSGGKIYINGKRINKRPSFRIDKIRNINIGYIFQNYNLLNHLSVFENISIALKMSGVKNKKEIEKRVNYVLKVLGIYKYRHRPANMLSGGEKQRVAIARALVKNPKIIIADEPTGNLDSKNTLEIMNILKSISKDKLVILVTHEKNIAEFYASRIIEVVDGKVVADKENIHNNDLDYRMDSKIYLKELENHKEFKKDNINVSVYSDRDDELDVKLVLKNGNIYIEAKSHKVELVDENSSIELVDDVYKKISKEEHEKYKFDYENIINPKYKMRYTSIYNPFNLVIDGFKKVFSYSILKKIMLLGFVFSAMFIIYAVSNIRGITDIKEEKYISENHNYLNLIGKTTVDKYLEYSNMENVEYILPSKSLVSATIMYDDFFQTRDAYDSISVSLSSLELITSDNLIYGRMPENSKEIVLDKIILDRLLSIGYSSGGAVGAKSAEDFLEREITFANMYMSGAEDVLGEYIIVGISGLNSPSMYVEESQFIPILENASAGSSFEEGYFMMPNQVASTDSYLDNIKNVNLVKDKITLEKGRMPENDYEIIIPESLSEEFKLNKSIEQELNGNQLVVVGYYSSLDGLNGYYTTENTILYKLISESNNLAIYAEDKEEVLTYFRDLGLNIEDILEVDKVKYTANIERTITASVIVATVIIAISIIEIFLMLRSSFLSRVKEVGILRAIGMKKLDIYKMFVGEIVAITTLTSIPGILLMSSILTGLTQIPFYTDTYKLDVNTYIISLIIVIGVNLIFGLLPVFNVIRKTPARILSQNNVD